MEKEKREKRAGLFLYYKIACSKQHQTILLTYFLLFSILIPIFLYFHLISLHSIHHRCLTRIKYKLFLLTKTTFKTIVNSEGGAGGGGGKKGESKQECICCTMKQILINSIKLSYKLISHNFSPDPTFIFPFIRSFFTLHTDV